MFTNVIKLHYLQCKNKIHVFTNTFYRFEIDGICGSCLVATVDKYCCDNKYINRFECEYKKSSVAKRWGVQKSMKAVGPCNNWQSSVGLIANLSLMNISLGAHQGEWPCTLSPARSPMAGLCAGRSPSLRPSADWWTSFCSLSRHWGLCWVHSTYAAGYRVNFIYILTTVRGTGTIYFLYLELTCLE